MGKLHDTYKLTITTLSPLHIGTGNTLRQGYDYVTHRGQTWVFDAEVLADALYEHDPDEFEKMVQGVPASDLIRPDEYDPASPLFRYVLRGEPRSKGKGAELQEQLKDPWDRPYIPGSSLKGALRTALAYVGWQQRKLVVDPSELGRSARTAAQSMEHKVLFGSETTPNYDLLRALQVSDTNAVPECLELANVEVVGGSSKASIPVALEAIESNTVFQASLSVDFFLMGLIQGNQASSDAVRELGWDDTQLGALVQLAGAVYRWTRHRLNTVEAQWQRDPQVRSSISSLRKSFQSLDQSHEFMLQLGWGGGWDSKTFGYMLTQNPTTFQRVLDQYRSAMVRRGKADPTNYPSTRRVVVRETQPNTLLGWIKVRMERV